MTIKPGALRFNTDSMKLEIFRGSANYEGSASMAGIGTLAAGQWEEIQATSPDVLTGGTRGLIGRAAPSNGNIGYFNFATTGDTITFGSLTTTRTNGVAAIASRTRAIYGGGNGVPTTEFVTIASTGDASDFGDLTTANQLSFVLLFFILLLFILENLSRKGAKYHQNSKGNKPIPKIQLAGSKSIFATCFCSILFFF